LGVWKSVMDWLSITGSFVQDYGEFKRLKFRPTLFNGDFILRRELPFATLSLHQALEPGNTEFGHMIDFEVEGALLVIKLNQDHPYTEVKLCAVMECFDYAYHKKNYLFCMLKKMTLEDEKTTKALKDVMQILDE
jgi:hypothetical protein